MGNRIVVSKEKYEGKVYNTNEGYEVKVIKYENKNKVLIEFLNLNYFKYVRMKDVKIGSIRYPFHKSIFEIGYLGEKNDKWSSKDIKRPYKTWHSMLTRCYDKKFHEKHPTYKDCTVCEEWHNFQNFARWYEENYYEVDGETMCLDKDILVKGNKIYSPETCVFVPKEINNLFIKSNSIRGNYPIGVNFHKSSNKFQAICEREYLGVFNTVEEAFGAYKLSKERYIKEIAEKYKNKIPDKLYNAMKEYEVEVND